MKQPSIAVVIPAHNAERFISGSVTAVLSQTRPPDELIVVDDGSTDSTLDELQRFRNEARILTQANRGAGGAYTSGFAAASSDYIARCDADDVWKPTKLEQQIVGLTEHPTVDIAFSGAVNFGAADIPAWEGIWDPPPDQGLLERHRFTRHMYRYDAICASTAIVRRTLFRRLGPFVTPHPCEDYDYWLRALKVGARFFYDPAILVRYRRHSGSVTSDLLRMYRGTYQVHLWHKDLVDDRRFVRDVLAQDRYRIAQWLFENGESRRARRAFMASARRRPALREFGWALALCAPERHQPEIVGRLSSLKHTLGTLRTTPPARARAPGRRGPGPTDPRRRDSVPPRLGPLLLAEPHAHILGGHWSDNLVVLAEAARSRGTPVTIGSMNGIFADTQAALEGAGAAAVGQAERDRLARVYRSVSRRLERCFELAHWLRPKSRWPYQLTLLSRCFAEAASLRMALTTLDGEPSPTAVVFSASDTLAGAVAALSGTRHIRIVHEIVYSWEGPVLRGIERACRRSRGGVIAVCPTPAVETALKTRYPDLRSVIQPFAIVDPTMYVSQEERELARRSLGLAPGELVGALVGGWWPTKDIDTVERALGLTREAVGIVIAGSPVDEATVERMRSTAKGPVIVLARELVRRELRHVYAASDFTIVSRFPGEQKESGLVMDAARYGVPLVVSDHDPVLNGRLAGHDWVRFFRACDPADLAEVLDDLVGRPPVRPSRAAAAGLGMLTGGDVVDRLERLGATLGAAAE
jgi:glycosyltransferase involved in cell wall biosynthesis